MSDRAPRLLFVPVSGAFGMGEYARSLAIAQGATQRWPRAAIHFILSREAPYAATVPFQSTLLDSSPTFHSAKVIAVIAGWHPDVVIFDNAGRTAQLRAAKRAGARLVFISSRSRQRNKAFRFGWMRDIDEHWIAYPEFIAGQFSAVERLKLKFLRRPTVRFLDVILARGAGHESGTLGARTGCTPGYVLVVPGGGTGHPDVDGAVDVFLQAARELAAAGIETVYVGRARLATDSGSQPRMVNPVPQADLMDLMRGARLIIANGGSTLLQGIACGKPCIGVAIAGDQAARIRRCVAAGVVVAAPLETHGVVAAAVQLLGNAERREALAGRATALKLADGVEVALRALAGLLDG